MSSFDQQTRQLEYLVEHTRRRLRRNAVVTGVALLEIAAIGWLIVAASVDLLLPLADWLRWVVWGGFWLVVAAVAGAWVIWPALRPMPMQRVAFLIERVLGGMHNRLVTVLDLRERAKANGHAQAGADPDAQTHGQPEADVEALDDEAPFARRLADQTTARLAGYQVDQVADPRPVRRMLGIAGLALVAAVILSLLLAGRLPTALARIMLPGRAIPPATGVSIEGPGELAVLQGEPITLEAAVTEGRVDRLRLRLRDASGRATTYPMDPVGGGRFAFTLDAVTRSYDYQLLGGGTWTLPQRLRMVRRPVIDHVAAEVVLPDYMKIAQARAVPEHADQISAPVESRVRLTAGVAGDVARGRLRVYRAQVQQTTRQVDERTLWVDDQLPADAEPIGTFRWLEADAYSGERAHAFDWDGRAYGFYTRLNPLELDADRPLAFALRLDPAHRPSQVMITLIDQRRRERATLVWGAPLTDPQRKARHTRHLGPLPEPGAWQPMQATLAQAFGRKINRPVKLHGLKFAINAGRARFDAIGSVRRTQQQRSRTDLELIAEHPMRRDPATGRWVGEAPVTEDARLALVFENPLGHANRPMQPIPVRATADQPPSLVVERPGRSVTLAEARPMPLVIRSFDDFGIARIEIQFGDKADRFGEPTPLARFDDAKASRVITAALDPTKLALEAGDTRYYRIAAADHRGQRVLSPPYALTLARAEEPDGEAGADTAGVLEGVGKLAELTGAPADIVTEALDKLPEGLKVETASEDRTLKLRNEDGSAMTAEQLQQMLEQWNNALTDPQRAALYEMLAERSKRAAELAEAFDALAAGADASAYSLPMEPEALRAMAEQARRLAELNAFDDQKPLDAEVMRRLAELQAADEQQQAQLAELQQQLEALDQARQQLAADPTQARQQMQQMRLRQQARQARDRLAALDEHLAAQQQAMAAQARQTQQMARQAAAAEADDLGQISRRTREQVDPETAELLERARQLLARRLDQQAQDQGQPPPAPWVPPGEQVEALPVEADTPEPREDEQELSDEQRREALRQRIAELEDEENADWWDQPVQTPPDAATRQLSDRYADRQRPVDEAADPDTDTGESPAGRTPRQMLQEHHQGLGQALTQNSEELGGQRDALGRMMAQLDQAMAPPEQGPQVSGDPVSPQGQPGAQGAPGAQSQAGQPGQGGQGGAMSPQQMAAMQQTLDSPRMQQAMAMAAAASQQQAAAASGRGQSPGSAASPSRTALLPGGSPDGRSQFRPGPVQEIDLDAVGIDPDGRAGLYRLPPTVRQPLLQGMSEQGPEAYQPLINAYYRELTRQVDEP